MPSKRRKSDNDNNKFMQNISYSLNEIPKKCSVTTERDAKLETIWLLSYIYEI